MALNQGAQSKASILVFIVTVISLSRFEMSNHFHASACVWSQGDIPYIVFKIELQGYESFAIRDSTPFRVDKNEGIDT